MKKINKLPKVVIAGRVNVGKSSLFNRLSRHKKSLVMDFAGVTRDYVVDTVTHNGISFELIDTGGLCSQAEEIEMLSCVKDKALEVMQQAAVIVFVVDGAIGVLSDERSFAKVLHKLGKPVIIAVNKIDVAAALENLHEVSRLGFDNVVSVSAAHATGVNQLLDAIVSELSIAPVVDSEEHESEFNVVLLGKPNVGKSSLMNILTNQERTIVSDVPGTTREAISEKLTLAQSTIELTDTAGVRRHKKVHSDIETLMVKSSLDALRKSNVILLLIDASEGQLADQELKLAFYAFKEQGKAVILVMNKSDLSQEYAKQQLAQDIEGYEFFIDKLETVTISCKTKKNIYKLIPLLETVWKRYKTQFSSDELTEVFKKALVERPLYQCEHRLEVHRAEQIRTAPITISLKVNYPKMFSERDFAYFEKALRNAYDLKSVPVIFRIAG
jgi:GTP-binding protein